MEDHATSDSEHVQVEEVNLEEDRNSRQRFTRSRQRAKQNIMDLAILITLIENEESVNRYICRNENDYVKKNHNIQQTKQHQKRM